MSLSAVSPCTSPHAAHLPDQFTINFSRDELLLALRWCERFAPADGSENIAVVSLGAKQRKWTFVEDNVMGYYINGEASSCEGVIPVTRSLLAIATDSTQNDSITIEFNVLQGVYRLLIDAAVTELPMPYEWDIDPRFDLSQPETVLAKPSDVVAMGRTFMATHVNHSVPAESLESPFLTCVFENGVMTAQRSWAKWGGHTVSSSIPVNGVYSGVFSCAADVVVREMYYVDIYCEGSVVIDIATTGNPVVTFRGQRCGFSFIASEEYVHSVRQSILDELIDSSCDLHVDSGNEWDPTVRVVSQGREIDITIKPNSKNVAEYVRISHCLPESLQLTLDLAEEINAWNSALGNLKLVHRDSRLFVITDVSIKDLSTLPDVIDGVVTQSRKVSDFVFIFQ